MGIMSSRPAGSVLPVETLVDLLRLRAREDAPGTGYTMLVDGEANEVSLTFAELDRRARAIAAELQSHDAAGERALLLYPSGLDYIAAFFGCLYAGVVAVPAYPPRKNRSLDRIERILADAEGGFILSTEQILRELEVRFADHPHLLAARRLMTDEMGGDGAEGWVDPGVSGETVAFLQYTSGSTGQPKGVMVSHANLLNNEHLIQTAFGMTSSDIVLGWLPLYHDMGLIGNVLQPLYAGNRCVLMAPVQFLEKPVRWLQAISRYRATVSGGPDFSYDLCVRKIAAEQCHGLDLSSWGVAYNGSEPVRAETIQRFTEAFAPYGFKANAFFPCYGLAEATLFVSGGARDEMPVMQRVDGPAFARNEIVPVNGRPEDVRTLVGSGRVWKQQDVRIVDPENLTPCEKGRVGEIWISGSSVAHGYWNHPRETVETFAGHVAAASEDTSFLRTGDLGFVQDDVLFVTGRLKDLIIIRGRNHYPQDIEGTVGAAHPALRSGYGAAFSIEVDGEEKLAVVQEVERSALRSLDVHEIAGAVRQAVSDEHELQVHTLALLKTGSIPKTTSGKIQRRRCKAGLVADTLHVVGRSDMDREAPPEQRAVVLDRKALADMPIEARRPFVVAYLRDMVGRALKMHPSHVELEASLGQLGLDSINIVELKAAIETDFSVTVHGEDTLAGLSIADLAEWLALQVDAEADLDLGTAPEVGVVERDLFAKCESEGGYFGKYRLAKDRYFTQPVLEGPIGPRMRFDGHEVIVWSINDYLGLANHPAIWARTQQAIADHGTWSPMGSRLLTGNTKAHIALEERFARFTGKESSIVFNYGYMGVMGTIASLMGEHDTVIIDSLSHACIVDGALLASRGKRFKVFRHNDLESLEEQLQAANKNRRGGVMVVTEGLFGMTGDLAPLPGICDLKDRYDARLFIDDAHGFGTMGPTGVGTAEHQGVQDRIDLYFGTFAKSFAGIGGVTAGPEKVVDYIRYNSRTNVFAKSLPLIYVNAVDAALDVMEKEPERRERMWHISRRLQSGLADLGFNLGSTVSPITPVIVPAGDEETATRAMRLMRSDYGIFVSAVTYPVVPRGVVLFRMTSTAAHSDEDVDRTLEAFDALRRHIGMTVDSGDGHVGKRDAVISSRS